MAQAEVESLKDARNNHEETVSESQTWLSAGQDGAGSGNIEYAQASRYQRDVNVTEKRDINSGRDSKVVGILALLKREARVARGVLVTL